MTQYITHMTLTEVSEAISKKKLSSLEVTEACLKRMEELSDKLQSTAEINFDFARAQAKKADEDFKNGIILSALHGIPLAHKDMYYRSGRISGCGSSIRKDFVPNQTSTALRRLDHAGALDIARLNMVEFALGVTGHNDVMPTPKNPWNKKHFTGGSSSGSGVAVASRLVFGALGSDTGGSIRLPAACCGVVGMKPTSGRVSRYGAMPLSHSLDTIGPLTRTVKDNASILQAIAGRDENDPTTSNIAVPSYLNGIASGVKGIRIGVPDIYFYDHIDSEVYSLMSESLALYQKLGAEIVPVKLPISIRHTNALTIAIIASEGSALHQNWLKEKSEQYGAQTRARFLMGLMIPAVMYNQALNLRAQLLSEFTNNVFTKVDILHAPVITMPVPEYIDTHTKVDPDYLEMITRFGHCTRPVNYLGLPSLCIPCGFTSNGLPSSFQLIGKPFDEETLYRIGYAYERETNWISQHPSL